MQLMPTGDVTFDLLELFGPGCAEQRAQYQNIVEQRNLLLGVNSQSGITIYAAG